MSSHITMAEVARNCGVSRQTVSFVLNGRAHLLRPETVAKVQTALATMGYRPNAAALAVRHGRTHCVSLLHGPVEQGIYLPHAMLWGVQQTLARHDHHLTLCALGNAIFEKASFQPLFFRRMDDGIIVNYESPLPKRVAELVACNRIPLVHMNQRRTADCVHCDDLAGGRLATEALLAAGHRRIAYLNFFHDPEHPQRHIHHSGIDRYAAYQASMRAAGLTPSCPHRDRALWDDKDIPGFCADLLRQADRPTGFVCYGNHAAHHLLFAAVAAGLRIPADLSVIVFAGKAFHGAGRGIDTILVPEFDTGAAAAELILEKLGDPERRFPPVVLPSRHLSLGSIAAPPLGTSRRKSPAGRRIPA
jgi:LacI family transcriptional regulator